MPARDHLIDAARVLSVLAVVVYHCLFFEVRLDDGALVVTRWVPDRPLLVAGWFVMLLPVFFIASGFGHAASAQRAAATPTDAARTSRLAPPILLFVTVLAAVSTVAAWLPGTPPSLPYPGTDGLGWLELAAAVGRDYADFLWFLTVYLALVILAPLMVRAHERWGAAVPLALAVGAAAVDQLGTGAHLRNANWLLVWLACHQFGIGLQRGWFRRGPAWVAWAAVAVGAAAVVALVAVAGYPLSPIANYYPPSLAVVALGLAQAAALGLLGRAGVLREVGPRTGRLLAVVGPRLLTIYLWQAACIILAILALVGLGRLVPALAPVLVSGVGVVAASFAVIALVVPVIGRAERWLGARLARRSGSPGDGGVARVAPVLLLAGTALVWQNGAVLHPAQPWSTAGVLLVWLGSGLSLCCSRPRSRTPRG